jgi:hypothetical protein
MSPRRCIVAGALIVFLALAGLPAPLAARAAERVAAPELEGATDYFGTDKPVRLKDLRGKIVILDFWTLC